ncbi:hypothetical protein LBMAG42_23860 [Deltaproteobacteria bacterium]|nr:hypothetical protein LBMAG42_23860 [Deltaproteobacteria bacterium]
MVATLLLLLAPGCDRDGGYYVADPNSDYPFIQDLGEFRIISAEEQEDFSSLSDEAQAEDELGRKGVYYGGLGAPADPSYYGGATFNFLGTGGDVCVVVDPEAVFWNQAQSPQATTSDYLYLDETRDDADLDLDVGLTAYYTGSPGVEMGGFELVYSDPSGVDHNLSFSECLQIGYTRLPGSHSGRSTLEYCTVGTRALQGVSMTGVLDTFLLPINDGVAHYALGVFEGNCTDVIQPPLGLDYECFLQRETDGARDIPDEQATDDYCKDPDNEWNYACLEQMYCDKTKKLNEYCEDHFDDEDAPCIDNGVHPPADDAAADVGL